MARPIPHCTYCDRRTEYADLRRLDGEWPPYFRCRDEGMCGERMCGERMRGKGLAPVDEVRGLVSGDAGVRRGNGPVRVG